MDAPDRHTTDKETHERTDGRTDQRRDAFSLTVRPFIRLLDGVNFTGVIVSNTICSLVVSLPK